MTDFFLYEGGVYPEGLSVDFWHYPMDAHPWTDGLHNGVHICEKLRRSQKTTVDSQLKWVTPVVFFGLPSGKLT